MSEIKLHNTDWDLEFKDGDLQLCSDAVETAQRAKYNCLTIVGDLFDKMLDGIPYFDQMFSPVVGQQVKAFYFEKAINEAPRVSSANVVFFEDGNVEIDIFTDNQELRIKL